MHVACSEQATARGGNGMGLGVGLGVGWDDKYPGNAAMEPLPVDMQHGRTDWMCLRRGRLGNHTRPPQRARDPGGPHRLACLHIARGSRSEANDGAFMQRVCRSRHACDAPSLLEFHQTVNSR